MNIQRNSLCLVFLSIQLLSIHTKALEKSDVTFSSTGITTITLNSDHIKEKIKKRENKSDNPKRIGISIHKNINVLQTGIIDQTDDGTLYRLRIFSQGAQALLLKFSPVDLPKDCYLSVKDETGRYTDGPYTAQDVRLASLITEAILGETIIVELWVPETARRSPSVVIDRVGHCYKTPTDIKSNIKSNFINKKDCRQIDLERHSRWMKYGRSVVNLHGTVVDVEPPHDVFTTAGTGFLISNQQDYNDIGDVCQEDEIHPRLFLLTACHVIDFKNNHDIDATDRLGLQLMTFAFNDLTTRPASYIKTAGSDLLAHSMWEQFAGSCSDFGEYDWALLELWHPDRIIETAQPYFTGIQLNTALENTIVNIHHPNRRTKKINFSSRQSFGPFCDDIWVIWGILKGYTAPGSSGSPLFDSITKKVVGLVKSTRFLTGDCSPKAYGTNITRAWESGLAAFLTNPQNPINGGSIPGIDTAPVFIPDFSRFNGGEHDFTTTSNISLGLSPWFNHADVKFRAHSIGYNQEMDPSAPAAGLSFWNNSNAEIHTNYWDVPIMTIGDPQMYMSDHTKVRIYACETVPIENYELHAMEEVELQVNNDVQIGQPTDAVSSQAITYQPWAKLTIEAPHIEINQPLAAKFILPQQQQEFGGYVRLISYEGASIGNPEMHTIDIQTISHIALGGLMTQGRNVFFRMYQTGNLEIEAINSLYFKNTTIQFDRLPVIGPNPPVVIRGQTLDAELFELMVENRYSHIDFYGGVVNGNKVDIFMPPGIHVPYPYHNVKNAHKAVDKSVNDSQVAPKPETPVIEKIAPKPASYEDSTDFDLYFTAESWDMENIKIKSAKQSKVLVQANSIRISRESEINTKGSVLKKNGVVVLRALPQQQTAQFTAELKDQIIKQIKRYSIKNDIRPFVAQSARSKEKKTETHKPIEPQDIVCVSKTEEKGSDENKSDIRKIECSAYPNPFNPATKIKFNLPINAQVQMTMYNMLGQRVEQIVNREYTAGQHRVWWRAQSHPSGTYFCVINAYPRDGTQPLRKTIKLALVK